MTGTEREKAGLRGPVKTCGEETINDGGKFSITWEYNLEGQLLTVRQPDGSVQVMAQSTDAVGQSEFFYDEKGRKTTIQSFQRTQAGVPVGGKVRTIYNEKDQPTEVQVLDADGQVVSRVVRTYDADGRISEEKPIWENPVPTLLGNFPAAVTEAVKEQLTPEQINKGLCDLLGGRSQAGTWYTYDTEGRITKICERNMAFERIITTTYNDHGDRAEERTTFADNSFIPVGVSGSKSPFSSMEPTEFRYEYQYDEYGNWTQQTTFFSSDSPYSVCHRKLSYY